MNHNSDAGLRDPLSPSRAVQRVIYVCLVIAGLFYILPFALAVVTGFKSLPDFAANASSLLFDRSLGSPTLNGLRGSLTVSASCLALAVQLGTGNGLRGRRARHPLALAGYALARIKFPGYRLVFAVILGGDDGPERHPAIPRFIVLKELGLSNTYPGMIVPLVIDAPASS